MKAFYIDRLSGKLLPYTRETILTGPIKFLYYILPGEKVLVMASTDPPLCADHMKIHEKSTAIIPEGRKPVGAGLFSAQRKIFEDWESITMEIITPKGYRTEIAEFLLL